MVWKNKNHPLKEIERCKNRKYQCKYTKYTGTTVPKFGRASIGTCGASVAWSVAVSGVRVLGFGSFWTRVQFFSTSKK